MRVPQGPPARFLGAMEPTTPAEPISLLNGDRGRLDLTPIIIASSWKQMTS